MATSTWLIGSHPNVPLTTLTITVGATTETATIPAGAYYLDDPSSSRSLCKAFQTALVTHSSITSATVALCQDRKVRVSAANGGLGAAVSVTFSNNTVRDILGFTSMSSAAATHVAQAISSYVWSPNRVDSSPSRLGTPGRYKYDTAIGSSAAGDVVATTNNYIRENTFKWNYVENARVWTTAEAAGEFFHFHHNFLRHFWKFKVYRGLTDDTVSTTALSLVGPLGPYIMRPNRDVGWEYRHEIRNVEKFHGVELDVHGTREYA